MRSIDADALHDSINKETYRHTYIEQIHSIIDNAPTIDAVKHGKWIEGELYIKCSECGYPVGHLSDNYCPNRGAKMRDSKMLGKEAECIIDEANAYKREKGESHEIDRR